MYGNLLPNPLHGYFSQVRLTGDYICCMPNLRHLHIGATTYPLFEHDDFRLFPTSINCLVLNGYGWVKNSVVLDEWKRWLRANNGVVEEYC
jgi:hypothetical protein